MNSIKRIIFHRFTLYVVGMVLAALVIWFIGPLLGVGGVEPLSGAIQRTLAIVLIPAILGLGAVFSNSRLAYNNNKLADEIGQSTEKQQEAAAREATAEEVADLGKRLQEALDLMKKSRVRKTWGRGWLYTLPWYMFIGPPGSGKTTALINSGLNFPLAEKFGKKSIKGVGGTRSCDWWFTDEAVLIDTAGRYTTQDSEAMADAGAWSGFLKLLKKFRKRQPINGAIVAVGLSDLLYSSEDQRVEQAAAIRARIKELYAELGVRFPVYMLWTKADLISGFVEFFEDLGREEREQVWGMTFELGKSDDAEGAIDAYMAEFDALVGRLNGRLMERLQQEVDIERRALIFGFPQQVASLRDITNSFLQMVFAPNRFEEPSRLRGIYMASGTQEGTPIDRLMGAMAASFGISRPQAASASGQGRSYFLTRLMRDVVFGEAGLVSADPKIERRNRLVHYGVLGGAGAAILLMIAAWFATYSNNAELIADVDRQVAAYNEQVKDVPTDRINTSDVRPILPLLNTLRDMPGGYAKQNDDVPTFYTLGLYQGAKLGAGAIHTYEEQLGRQLLPRLLLRLEGQMAQNQNQPDFLYEALKIYLMLGGQAPHGHVDKALIHTWEQLDWSAQFPGPENEKMVNQLLGHLDAMLEAHLPTVPLNGPLVEDTRAILLRVPLASRAYNLVKTSPQITALPEWRVADHAGPAVNRVLVIAGGSEHGIPGLYTKEGYFNHFKPLLPDIAKEVSKEAWVLGKQSNAPIALLEDPATLNQLQRDITSLYLEDFAAQWDKVLSGISIVPMTSVAQATSILNVLSAPDSPLRALMISIADETTLSKPPASAIPTSPGALQAAATQAAGQAGRGAGGGGGGGGGGAGGGASGLMQQQFQSVLQAQTGGGAQDLAGPYTDTHFKALHDLVNGTGAGPAPLDAVMTDMDGLYHAMNTAQAAGNAAGALGGGAGGDGGASARLATDAARIPDPTVRTLVQGVAGQSSGLLVGGARATLNGLWTSTVVPFCTSALLNRYPVYAGQANEVTLDDFARLFAKGGLIDSFFDQNLRALVDQSKSPWGWNPVNGHDLGIPQDVLLQFQRAAAIRDSMFPGGAGKPGVNFELVPVSLDPRSTSVTLELDGQTVAYANGPPTPSRLTWPGPTGVGRVRVSFQPQNPGETTTLDKDGVWAWWRLLDTSQMHQTTGADRYAVVFKAGDRVATFEIHANSVINPFGSNLLQSFRCPPRL